MSPPQEPTVTAVLGPYRESDDKFTQKSIRLLVVDISPTIGFDDDGVAEVLKLNTPVGGSLMILRRGKYRVQ